MSRRYPGPSGLSLLLVLLASAAHAQGAPTEEPTTPVFIGGVRDTGQFLPDTVVMLRVGDRVRTVGDFRAAWFALPGNLRPAPDSAGRVEFIQTMIHKEVMGLSARAIVGGTTFEERTALREHTNRVLSDALYQRMVADSARMQITEDMLKRMYEQFRYEVHLRHIQFADRAGAEEVRARLVNHRITWSDAVRQYTVARRDKGPDGDIGWIPRMGMDVGMAEAVFRLRIGETSGIIADREGFHIVQVIERRQVPPPSYRSVRSVLISSLMRLYTEERGGRFQSQMLERIEFVPDTANINWASRFFNRALEVGQDARKRPMISLDFTVPRFEDRDLKKVLARYRGGEFTLGDFLSAYTSVSPITRPPVSDPASMLGMIGGVILTPYYADLARERGLEKDSMVVAQVEKKREDLMVTRLYRDSVESFVRVTPQMRRRYFDQHRSEYSTSPEIRFAAFFAPRKSEGDSLLARLNSGTRPEEILRADSLAGVRRGSIQTRRQSDGGPYQRVLFEVLRPGKSTLVGPDENGDYLVLELLGYTPSRPLTFDEAEEQVDQAVNASETGRLLDAFMARRRAKYPIEAHPERVMRIRLIPPTE